MAPTGSGQRTGDARAQPQTQSPAASSLAKVSGVATPRRREKKVDKGKEEDIVKRLQAICTDADPTRLYRSLVKIGQGYVLLSYVRLVMLMLCSASGGVYTAYQVGTNLSVAIKQMDLEKQPKKDLIINEILVMRSSRHPNIVNYIDSFLHKNDLWVVMEYMEGGSLTDVVTANLMTEGQIAAVSRETCQGLEHLHRHGVIHRDIKSDNVLLSLTGDIKLSECCFSFTFFFVAIRWFFCCALTSFYVGRPGCRLPLHTIGVSPLLRTRSWFGHCSAYCVPTSWCNLYPDCGRWQPPGCLQKIFPRRVL